MKVTLQSTPKIVTLQTMGNDTVNARIWQGETESGIPVHTFVVYIVPEISADDPRQLEFFRELEEQAAPRPAVRAIDMRLLI